MLGQLALIALLFFLAFRVLQRSLGFFVFLLCCFGLYLGASNCQLSLVPLLSGSFQQASLAGVGAFRGLQ